MYFSKSENLSFPNANQKKHLRPEFTKRHSFNDHIQDHHGNSQCRPHQWHAAAAATALHPANSRQGVDLGGLASHGGPDVQREKWVGGP